jgi:hypothetical protein
MHPICKLSPDSVFRVQRVDDMQFGGFFWWNFWVAVQILIVVAVGVALMLFIRWGRRKRTTLDGENPSDPRNPADRA